MPDQTDQNDQAIGNDHIFCSHCGTENAQGGHSCGRCGERLIEITTETTSPMGFVSCARCGSANNTRAEYCWVCGTEMDDAIRLSPAPQPEPKRVAGKFQPDLNPISVPRPASQPKDERADLRGPTPGSISGGRPARNAGPTPAPDSASAVDEPETNTSGTKGGVVPLGVKGWNWAAFLVSPIWGIFSGVPIAALMLTAYLPVFPAALKLATLMAGSLFLGFRGNELAWRGKKWRSVKHFKAVQHRWLVWSIGLNLVGLVLLFWFTGSSAEG